MSKTTSIRSIDNTLPYAIIVNVTLSYFWRLIMNDGLENRDREKVLKAIRNVFWFRIIGGTIVILAILVLSLILG